MSIQLKKNIQAISVAVILTITAMSCNKDKNKDEPEPSRSGSTYAIAQLTGTGSQKVTYLQTLESLDGISHINTSQSVQVSDGMYGGFIDSYAGAIYFGDFASPTLKRYNPSDLSKPTASLTIPGGAGTGNFWIKNAQEAYYYVQGQLKVYKFDPTAMSVSTVIDLTDHLRPTDDQAAQTRILEVIGQDNRLFVAYEIMYGFSSGIPPRDTAYVAILENDSFKKVLKDTRTMTIGSNTGNASPSMQFDEHGHLYLHGNVFFGMANIPNRPSGILRIKKGANDFDPDYFFNTKDLGPEKANGNGLWKVNGSYYTMVFNPSQAGGGVSYNSNANIIYKLDLNAKTGVDIGMDPVKGFSHIYFWPHADGKSVMVGSDGATEKNVHIFDPQNNLLVKKFTTEGSPQLLRF